MVNSLAWWHYQRHSHSFFLSCHPLGLLVSLEATCLLLLVQIAHEDLTKLSRLEDSFPYFLKMTEAFHRWSATIPHVSMGRTGHIYIYAREMGPLWLTRKRADRPTLKLEFHQQRKEENYFWGGNRVPGLPRWFSGKESTSQCRRRRFYLLFRKISCRRKWQPLQYSYQENPMDRGTWQAIVHGVTKESDKT